MYDHAHFACILLCLCKTDPRDVPRDLENHFRIRFNASGLAEEGAPIEIKRPLAPAVVESPVAFQKLVKDGLDKSVHDLASPAPSPHRRGHKHVAKTKIKSKLLSEMQLEASRRGVDQVCSFNAQTSLYSEISRASIDELSRVSVSEDRRIRVRESLRANDQSFRMQSLSLASLRSLPQGEVSVEQNIEAARSISCVDEIFKENAGKGLVPR